MGMRKRICKYCNGGFAPSRYRPDQQICSSEKCQRRRRSDYHKRKLAEDPLYREQCLDSQKKWRRKNPGYSKRYRIQRRKSGLLKELHRLTDLVKNNVALDLRSFATSVWIVSPSDLPGEKNSLASAKLIVLQVIAHAVGDKGPEKNIPL